MGAWGVVGVILCLGGILGLVAQLEKDNRRCCSQSGAEVVATCCVAIVVGIFLVGIG